MDGPTVAVLQGVPSVSLEKTDVWPVVLYSGYPEVIFYVLIVSEQSL